MTTRTLTPAEMLRAIADIQARNPNPATPRDEASDGPGERVVTGDLDEHRAQAEDNRRWRAWP